MASPRLFLFSGRFVALAVALACAACASQGTKPVVKTNGGKMFAVVADSTSFYRYGPQQGNGADQTLPKDTLMTLIRPSFGYAKVQLVTGGEGYVASEDIKPAPPTLLAALTAPAPTPAIEEREHFDVQSSEPPPPEELPDPDLPPVSTEPLPEP